MNNKITELFSYDLIDISGYAVMDGDATLLPQKSLWGDIEIEIQPLTIIIKDGDIFSFVPKMSLHHLIQWIGKLQLRLIVD